jgi:hypothetical protein
MTLHKKQTWKMIMGSIYWLCFLGSCKTVSAVMSNNCIFIMHNVRIRWFFYGEAMLLKSIHNIYSRKKYLWKEISKKLCSWYIFMILIWRCYWIQTVPSALQGKLPNLLNISVNSLVERFVKPEDPPTLHNSYFLVPNIFLNWNDTDYLHGFP